MIAADYSEGLACPVCGFPARRKGRWYLIGGEWRHQDIPIICRIRKSMPRKMAGWEHVTIQKPPTTDWQGNTKRAEAVEEYHWISTHECMGTVFGDCDRYLLQYRDCDKFTGEPLPWMSAPTDEAFPVAAVMHDIKAALTPAATVAHAPTVAVSDDDTHEETGGDEWE